MPSYTDLLLYTAGAVVFIAAVAAIIYGIRRLVDFWDELTGNPAPDHEGVTDATTMLIVPTTPRQLRLAELDDATRFFVPAEWVAAARGGDTSRHSGNTYVGRHSPEHIAEITGSLNLPAVATIALREPTTSIHQLALTSA